MPSLSVGSPSRGRIGAGRGNAAATTVLAALEAVVEPPSDDIGLLDRNGDTQPFTAEAFFNQDKVFAMVYPKKRLRGGRRTKLVQRLP